MIDAHRSVLPQIPAEAATPEVHPATLGLQTVKYITKVANGDVLADDPDADHHYAEAHRYNADAAYEDLKNELHAVRARLRELTPAQQVLLETYCNASTPEALQDHKNTRSAPYARWYHWLGTEANDPELRAFLEWHVRKIEAQQNHTEVQTTIENERELYKLNVRFGVEDGWLNEDALVATRTVDDVEAYVGDIFDTLMQDRGGYHTLGTKEIVIAGPADGKIGEPEHEGWLKNICSVVTHEYNHAVLGRLSHRWLNEALTEHINLALHSRNPEDPNLGKGTYKTERSLLAALLKGPDETSPPIPHSVGTLAYSETTTTSAIHAFNDAIEAKWGKYITGNESAISMINKHIASIERKYQDTNKSLTIAEIQEKAAKDTLEDLEKYPEKIFDDYFNFPDGTVKLSS